MDFPRSEATAATEAYSNLNMACAALAGHARDILATALDSVELGDFAFHERATFHALRQQFERTLVTVTSMGIGLSDRPWPEHH
jgi:hypothetical protein